jgi:glycosidase
MRRLLPFVFVASTALAQSPVINKIDPPNWWPQMPAPMLLVYGENLQKTTTFSLSDKTLHVEKKEVSDNGHYARLWLDHSPARPETIQIQAKNASEATKFAYTFAPKRLKTDGFAGFSSKDVMYLIMTDRFADGDPTNDGPDHTAELAKSRGWHGGDLKGITAHLDYLQQLGITTVWITPVYQNHGHDSYHGYGATDMYAVDEHFGNLQDVKDLAEALHARKMKLVLDTVPNHIGPAHPWVTDSPDPTWFHGTLAHHTIAQGEFAPVTDPHAPWRDQHNVTEGWFANTLPDMNQEDPAVAKYLTQNAIWWIEQAGLDGLRIDTFPYIARPFWHEFHAEIHALYPQLTTVGEVYNGDPTITSTFAGGVTRTGVDTGLDTPFDFPTFFALREVLLKDAPMTKLADVLRLDNLFPHPERLVPFLGNHDNARFLGEAGATPKKLELAFTILTTMRGMPQIYSGDEIAMRGGEDPDNRHDFPGGFGTSQGDAFTAAGRTPDQEAMHGKLQAMLAMRASHPALQTGSEQILHADKDVLVYVRSLQGQRVLVAVNKGKTAQTVVIPTDDTEAEGLATSKRLLGTGELSFAKPHEMTVTLGAEDAVVVEVSH